MEQFSAETDSNLIDKIVCEVKSQGLFDQFRRECLADVDTKPAYQNLQHRVESSVVKFLSDQIWTPEMNKNQLREKLRKYIIGKGFLDSGVERIVDQVVNPKLNTNFVPKIEDVSYAYLGIEKPESRPLTLDINPIGQQQFLPNLDLEQVSPESSEKSPSLIEEKEDLESPAFEVITAKAIDVKEEKIDTDDDKMDISDDSNEVLNKSNEETNTNDENKSNLSSISGLTSNESIGEILEETEIKPIPSENDVEKEKIDPNTVKMETGEIKITAEVKVEIEVDDKVAPVVQEIQLIDVGEQPEEKPSIHYSGEVENTNQDSVLSQVSSNSRLSIITNTRLDAADEGSMNTEEVANENKKNVDEKDNTCPYGISEEAQMQQFNESSSSSNGLMIDTDRISNGDTKTDEQVIKAFDIKKEDIKFEGTERKSFDVDTEETNQNLMEKLNLKDEIPTTKDAENFEVSKDVKNDSFNSSNGDISKTEEIESPKPDEILLKTETNSGLDDFKGIEDSNSSGSKSKDKSSSMSSSSQRSLIDADQKNKNKDRHVTNSSSKDRHRSDRDKDKRSHSSSHSSSRNGEGKHVSSSSGSKHRHESSSSKIHHRSSTSLSSSKRDVSRDKDKHRSHSDSSKKSNSSSHRHSSSTSHRDRKHDSKSSDRKSKNDSQRSSTSSTSSTKKDDHSSYKEKPLSRQRSRSKDSNDGNSNPSSAPNNPESNSNVTNPPSVSDEKQTTEQQQTSTNTSPISQSDCQEIGEPSSPTISTFPMPPIPEQNQDDFVMATQPIVVDQILTGSELNLEMFIDENRGDPIVSKIEHSLANQTKIKKPKVAANIHEARKLMKIRKQIDRDEQKKIEKAKVLAKQYIRSNATAVSGDDCQGVELEFACINSGAGPSITGPSISSPVKLSSSPEKADEHFNGFNEQDYIHSRDASEYLNDLLNKLKISMLKATKKTIPRKSTPDVDGNQSGINSNEQINEIFSVNESHKLFLENNRLQDSNKLVGNRKRKLTESSTTSDDIPNAKNLAESGEVANVVANVIISSQTSTSTATKSETSTSQTAADSLEKQRQKTRYSNDDLFKPRPLFSGGSRSRRRGVNCNE